MTLQRVQMLLEPRQRKKLAELAKVHGKSVAEITRQAIDAGLEKLSLGEESQRLFNALEAARKLRDSMPILNLDTVNELHQVREERANDLTRCD
jgi:hypothetical protein